MGDSIAKGVAEQMPECIANARVGIGSYEILRRTVRYPGAVVVISAGSNDPANPALPFNLEELRAGTMGSHFVWIAPRHPTAEAAVVRVAGRHGDQVIRLRFLAVKHDGVHPLSYPDVAARVRRVIAQTVNTR